MRFLTFALLSVSACTGGGFDDDDDEEGLVLPPMPDTEDSGDTDDTDTDTAPPEDTGDTGKEPELFGQIDLSDVVLKFTAEGTVAVTISNVGDSGLSISEILLSGEGEEAFSLGAPGAAALAPDSSTTFAVTFTPPLESGGWRGVATIVSDDPDNGELELSLAGGVGEPQLDFDEDPLEITEAWIGCERIGTAVLRNDGGGFVEITDLSLSGSSEMTLGKAAALPLSLLAGDTAEVEIIYLPSDEVADTGYRLVATDDALGTLSITGSAEPYDEGSEFFEIDKPTPIFELSDTPVETTIEVRVDGVDQSGNFTYDAKKNTVIFNSSAVPASGAVIEIEYAIAGGC